VKQRQQADTSGKFIFTNVGTGRYQVRVQVPGTEYREQTQDVDLTSGRVETVQLEFRLKPKNEPAKARAALVVFAQDVPEAAKRYFEAAGAEFAGGRQASAVEQLELAIKEFPTYFAALERLGVEQMIMKRYADAKKTFTSAVEVNTRSFNGWYGLAYANFALELSPEAIAAAAKAIDIDKNAAEVYFVVGMSERRLKNYDKAERAFIKAKDLDKGKTADIHWNLALLYAHNLKQYGKAAEELELFLKAAPDYSDVATVRKLIADFRSKSGK